jgi:hypothetical protein
VSQTSAAAPRSSVPAASRFASRLIAAPVISLAAVVGISTCVRVGLALRVPSPWILPDEIVYSELAKSIAAGERPSVRGVPVSGWGEVYPTLISPAWLVAENLFAAYHAALVINSFVMSLAAVPAYFLARLFVARSPSLVVAAMTVLVPSMTYTGAVMTENACYPVFLLAVLLVARAVRAPSAGNQTLAILGLGVLAVTRIQGAALVGAYAGAVAVYAWTGVPEERRAYLRRFAPTAVVLLLTAAGPALVSAASGDGVLGWLGTRSGTLDGFHPGELLQWPLYLLGGLLLYVAVVPAAATAIVAARGLVPRAPERLRLFAAVVVPTVLALVGSVSLVSAALDVDGTENLNERYVFYVVPLLFVGLALWIDDGLRRPKRSIWLVLIGCLLATVFLPIDRLAYNAAFQSPSLLLWISVADSRVPLVVLLTGFVLLCGALWLRCSPRRSGRLWILVGSWLVLTGAVAVHDAVGPARYFSRAYEGTRPSWVDEAVPTGSRVPVLWDQRRADASPELLYYLLAVTELFNSSIADVERIGPPTYYETFLPTAPASFGPERVVLDRRGEPIRAPYVLVTCRTPVVGRVVAEGARGGLQLVEVHGPLRRSTAPSCRWRGGVG